MKVVDDLEQLAHLVRIGLALVILQVEARGVSWPNVLPVAAVLPVEHKLITFRQRTQIGKTDIAL